MKKKSSILKNIILGLVALSLLAGTGLVLYFYLGPEKPVAFFVRDLNDASYDCEAKIVSKYDDELVSKYYDNLSSRYEDDKHQYLVYYRISVKEVEDGIPQVKDYMAKCIVWEKLGYVSDFRVYEF